MKRAQVTIFIIIALVIITGVLIFITLNKSFNKQEIPPEHKDVYNFVENCAKDSIEEVIYLLGLRGGYMFEPENSNEFGIPYYYINEENTMISKKELEEKASFYFNNKMNRCLNNFSEFRDKEITAEKINSNVKINKNNLILNLNSPISISQGENTYLIEDFEDIEIPIRLGLIHDVSKDIINNINNKEICITCIYDNIREENLTISIVEYNEDFLFTIEDNSTQINNSTFVYSFATKV